jgi:hypothetical protein
MNDRLEGEAQQEEDAVSETTSRAAATYTIKVLSDGTGAGGEGRRTVLFRRTSGGSSIEITVETDAPNLLAMLPELLERALETQRALWPARRAFFVRFAAEVRRVRWLTAGGRPAGRCPSKDDASRPGAPPRARGRGTPRGRERGRRGR